MTKQRDTEIVIELFKYMLFCWSQWLVEYKPVKYLVSLEKIYLDVSTGFPWRFNVLVLSFSELITDASVHSILESQLYCRKAQQWSLRPTMPMLSFCRSVLIITASLN